MTNRPSINSPNSRDRVARRAGCVFGRSGKKTGKNVESALYPLRLHGGGTAWRRRPRDAAASMTHIYTPRTRQPSLVRFPRGHRARSAPYASQVVRISKEGLLRRTKTRCRCLGCRVVPSAGQMTVMPCGGGAVGHNKDTGVLLLSTRDGAPGHHNRTINRVGLNLSVSQPLSHRSNPTDPDSTQMGESSILSLFWNQVERRRCVCCKR